MSERCERTSERTREWPSTLRVDFIVIPTTVRRRVARIAMIASIAIGATNAIFLPIAIGVTDVEKQVAAVFYEERVEEVAEGTESSAPFGF